MLIFRWLYAMPMLIELYYYAMIDYDAYFRHFSMLSSMLMLMPLLIISLFDPMIPILRA